MSERVAAALPDPARAWVRTVAPLVWSWLLLVAGRHGVDVIGWADDNLAIGMEVATGVGIVALSALLDGAARVFPWLDRAVHLLPGSPVYLKAPSAGSVDGFYATPAAAGLGDVDPTKADLVHDRPMSEDEWEQYLGGIS